MPLQGAKVFDVNAHSQLLLVSHKPADCGASSGLMKVQQFISPFKIYECQLLSDIWVDCLTGSFWSMIWNNREGWIQMSLMALSEGECIDVPSGTSVIRDIRIAPSGTRAPGRLALVASLGKKLTVFRYGHFFWPSFSILFCACYSIILEISGWAYVFYGSCHALASS